MLDQALIRRNEVARRLDPHTDTPQRIEGRRETTKADLTICMDDGSRNAVRVWRCGSAHGSIPVFMG
jgi:hypothetical protein